VADNYRERAEAADGRSDQRRRARHPAALRELRFAFSSLRYAGVRKVAMFGSARTAPTRRNTAVGRFGRRSWSGLHVITGAGPGIMAGRT